MISKLESVVARLHLLPASELDLIDWILEGIEDGVAVYGRFDPETDKRDLKLEAAKEFRDAFVYLAGDFMKNVLERRRRIECFRRDEEYRRANGLDELATFDIRDGQIHEVLK